jgi:hypothetical protein
MKVFLSYAQEDRKLAWRISDALKKHGLEVWDDREIMPGDNWASKVSNALRHSEAMVVLMTPKALKSKWISREVEYALGKPAFKNRLVTVLAGPRKKFPQSKIPWILRHLQCVELPSTEDGEEHFNKIAESLLKAG